MQDFDTKWTHFYFPHRNSRFIVFVQRSPDHFASSLAAVFKKKKYLWLLFIINFNVIIQGDYKINLIRISHLQVNIWVNCMTFLSIKSSCWSRHNVINVGHNSGSQGGQDLASFIGTMNYKQTWHIASLGEGDSSLSKRKARPFQKGDNWEIVEINWQLLKIFFSRTTGPIWTKLDTN